MRTGPNRWSAVAQALLGALALLLGGCQTTRPLPAVDLQEPGWQVRRGQAIWRPKAGAPELAGDFLLARHADGRALVQFLKLPFPTVTAWVEAGRWQIEYQPQDRRYGGPGAAPARLLLCHAAAAAEGRPLPAGLTATNAPASLQLRHPQSGETLMVAWPP